MKAQLQTLFQKYRRLATNLHLEKREKIILGLGSLFVLGFALLQLVINPYLDAREKLAQSIVRNQAELVTIKGLQRQYLQQNKTQDTILERISKRPSTFSLFTFLEQQSEKAGIKEQVKYMKPSLVGNDKELNESLVEMKLQKITLENLVYFLQLIESEELVVFVRKITIQTNESEQGYLDTTAQISTFVQAEN